MVKQALLGSFGRRGMDFGRGDKDETCGVLKTLLNHDLNYRKCRTCDDDVCVGVYNHVQIAQDSSLEQVFFPQNVSRRKHK